MGILNWFKRNDDNKEKLSHLKNLIALSMADGKLEKAELAAISAVISREGMTQEDLERCINNPKSIEFVPPTSNSTKIQHLKDMVYLMMADGNIDDNEVMVCKITAEMLGFKHEVIDAIVFDTIEEIKKEFGI